MTAKRIAGTLLAATALSVALASSAHAATPVNVSCGETITADTKLAHDLVTCPSNGIVIGADNVTLDLNGKTVDGDGESVESCPENEFCDVGVLNDGHDGVTVRGGSVQRFDFGAFVGRARDNRLLRISSSKNVLFGFVIAESTHSLVRGSSGSNNLDPDGDGMGLFGSHDLRIVDNSFQHNPLGLHVADSTDNLIKGNLFSGNGLGIFMEANGNQVRRNRSVRDREGILVTGSRNVIARNRYSRSKGGIVIEKGRGNLVARNVIVDARRVGIRLGLQLPEQLGGVNNVVRRNLVTGSGVDGFLVAKKDNHSRLSRNVARGAGDDGFDVKSRSTKLTGNRAVRNADLGIEAKRGVIDGGENRGRGNGDSRQCRNVDCY